MEAVGTFEGRRNNCDEIITSDMFVVDPDEAMRWNSVDNFSDGDGSVLPIASMKFEDIATFRADAFRDIYEDFCANNFKIPLGFSESSECDCCDGELTMKNGHHRLVLAWAMGFRGVPFIEDARMRNQYLRPSDDPLPCVPVYGPHLKFEDFVEHTAARLPHIVDLPLDKP